MARRREPTLTEAAGTITLLWVVLFATTIVLPRLTGAPRPDAAASAYCVLCLALAPLLPSWLAHIVASPGQLTAVLLVGVGFLMVGSWVLVIWVTRAQNARGKRLEELRAMTPGAFEQWVGARFRERGYAVEVTGATGDHGIDLVGRKASELIVVQAKKYGTKSVGEPVLRDLYGAMTAAGANGAYLVTTGRVTDQARLWAKGKPIEIWDAETVTRISLSDDPNAVDASPFTATSAAAETRECPRCGAPMVQRRSRRNGQEFWGCSTYPRCRQTQPV